MRATIIYIFRNYKKRSIIGICGQLLTHLFTYYLHITYVFIIILSKTFLYQEVTEDGHHFFREFTGCVGFYSSGFATSPISNHNTLVRNNKPSINTGAHLCRSCLTLNNRSTNESTYLYSLHFTSMNAVNELPELDVQLPNFSCLWWKYKKR